MKKALYPALKVMAGLLVLVTACLLIIYLSARALLAPSPGEWSVPLRQGPVQLQAGVPSLIRLATASWLAPLLDGRSLTTSAGPVHINWHDSSRTLALRCAPCTLNPPGQNDELLHLDEVLLTLHRQGEKLSGTLTSGKLHASWRSKLEKDGLRIRLQMPMTPIADAYALFNSRIPELAKARIDGQFELSAKLSLPEKELSLNPEIEGFQVSGLGTEALANTPSSCSKAISRLTAKSWLARAVVAAEDQRSDDYPGDVLTDLDTAPAPASASASASAPEAEEPALASASASLPAQQAGHQASTLSQQLTRLLVTGKEAHTRVQKLRELLYAVEMERTLGKPLILQLYLNQVPWGDDICGAEAASRHYFGVRSDVLSPMQAAWLAAMLHNPEQEVERWRRTGQINIARTQWVLHGMQDLPYSQRLRLKKQLLQLKWKAPNP